MPKWVSVLSAYFALNLQPKLKSDIFGRFIFLTRSVSFLIKRVWLMIDDDQPMTTKDKIFFLEKLLKAMKRENQVYYELVE